MAAKSAYCSMYATRTASARSGSLPLLFHIFLFHIFLFYIFLFPHRTPAFQGSSQSSVLFETIITRSEAQENDATQWTNSRKGNGRIRFVLREPVLDENGI